MIQGEKLLSMEFLEEKEYKLLELISRKKNEDLTYTKLFKLSAKEDVIRAKPTFNKVLRKLEELGLVEREYVEKGAVRRAKIKPTLLGEILVAVKYLERYVQVLKNSKSIIDFFLEFEPSISEKISFDRVHNTVLSIFHEFLVIMYTAIYVAKTHEDAKIVFVSELSKQLYLAYKHVLDLFPHCAKKLVEEGRKILEEIFKHKEEIVDLDFIRRAYGEEIYNVTKNILGQFIEK